MRIGIERIKNGSKWHCKWPYCWDVVVQWIGVDNPDQWVILSDDDPGYMGWPIRNVFVDKDGKGFRTKKDMKKWLEKYGARETTVSGNDIKNPIQSPHPIQVVGDKQEDRK